MDTPDTLGRHFHRQLFAVTGELHPEDEAHDLAVGQALLLAVRDGKPLEAQQQYNAWADAHGYAPIRWMGTIQRDGARQHVVDIRDAVILIGADYTVTVKESRVCQ